MKVSRRGFIKVAGAGAVCLGLSRLGLDLGPAQAYAAGLKIEGSKAVVTPSGERKVRDGFYLHGGNPADAVSSGCVKSLNDDAFTHIRTLTGVKGAVPFCVGTACEPDLSRAISVTVSEAVDAAVEAVSSSMREKLGF